MRDVKGLSVVFVALLCVLCNACSSHYASNTEQRYLQSRNGVNLVVPAPLTTANISHFYDLPEQNQNAKVSIRPPSV